MSDPGDEQPQYGLPDAIRDIATDRLTARLVGIRAIVPASFQEALEYADFVVQAGLMPSSYKTKQQVAIGILAGLEIRVPPMTALRNIMIVNNRYCVWGDLAVALAQRDGLLVNTKTWFETDREVYVDGDPLPTNYPDEFTAVMQIWRLGQPNPYEGRFSVRDARRAKLWGNTTKAPWIQYPTRMLFNRARAFAIRDGFADCLGGLSIREEIEDLPAEPKTVEPSHLNELLGPPADKPQTEGAGGEAVSESPAQEEP